MSMGNKSPLLIPITEDVIAITRSQFPAMGARVDELFTLLTDHLACEALLWFAVVDLIDRALKGEDSPETPGGACPGPALLLSGIARDGSFKAQTPDLKLLHDVVVELQMAGSNYRHLHLWLSTYGRELVWMHSCKVGITPSVHVDSWYERVQDEQLLRTRLDWEGPTRIVSPAEFLRVTNYPTAEYQHVMRIAGHARTYAIGRGVLETHSRVA